MKNYIIVDDEHIAHDIIKGYCDSLPNFSLVQHCYDAIEAMECLRTHDVDVVFLDLNMPKLKGFELLRVLQNPPSVIVTTAYQEHALEGYELNIVDYLLKPFSFERFMKAVNKLETDKVVPPPSDSTKSEDGLFLRSNKKLIQIKRDDILFIEALGNYVKIVTNTNEIRVREKISDILSLLPETDFFQVHKSFIIAKNHINVIEGNRISINDYIIPIGKTYKSNLSKLLG